ncbi:hypothetical protein EJ02DRAFT_160906 [Clathrospora elynae]|uniref:Uncharacterized protein n=1 Tax=Clathrospora elynae TaxID=706981 RepID=A0A6A5SQ73_9PLEO|nr:hypothetical protein EJ02DRAFT_160906 [Clathrospora elynae]
MGAVGRVVITVEGEFSVLRVLSVGLIEGGGLVGLVGLVSVFVFHLVLVFDLDRTLCLLLSDLNRRVDTRR